MRAPLRGPPDRPAGEGVSRNWSWRNVQDLLQSGGGNPDSQKGGVEGTIGRRISCRLITQAWDG